MSFKVFIVEYIFRGQGIEPSTRQGYGILCDSEDNEVYCGGWHDNQYHGQGRLVNFQAEQFGGAFDYRDLNTIENGWSGYNGSIDFIFIQVDSIRGK